MTGSEVEVRFVAVERGSTTFVTVGNVGVLVVDETTDCSFETSTGASFL